MIPYYHSLGDTLGYHNGHWEFNYGIPNVGPEYANDMIYEFISLGGVNDISIVNWMASDDTIMYMATYQTLLEMPANIIRLTSELIKSYGQLLRLSYLKILPRMENRHPGDTILRSLLIQENIEWDGLPYDSMAVGAGAVMRSGCIGIFQCGRDARPNLIALATETSRITHNSAVSILGSITAALFTTYGIEKKPIHRWPHKLLKILKSGIIDNYIKETRPKEYHLFVRDKVIFIGQIERYVNFRFSGFTPRLDLKIMKNPVERYRYLADNFSKRNPDFPGSLADDCIIMAYDALLESGGNIEKLIVYAILHPGDSDTVGAVAFSWFGAYYHNVKTYKVIRGKILELEFHQEMEMIMDEMVKKWADKLFFYNMYVHIGYKEKIFGENC